jgi:hypothetical protein
VTNTQAARPSNAPTWTTNPGPTLILACALALAGTVVVGRGVAPVAAILIVVSTLVVWHRWILSWNALLCFVIAVVLFVPVARYALAINLPFGLEMYRLALALVLLVWGTSLLIDPSVRLRRTPLDAPVALIVGATLCSVVVNIARVAPLASAVLKAITLFLSFIIFFYFISSVITSVSGVVRIIKFIVAGVAVVALFAIVEQRTGFNLFDHVRTVFPFLEFHPRTAVARFGLVRAYGSADHPIALGVLFAMTLPLGVALAKSRSSIWWVPTSMILIAVFASASRTPVLAIATATVAFLWLRPRDVLPLLPLAIPMLIVIKIAAPGSVATLKSSFFPKSGYLAEQSTLAADPTLISGRANLVPRIEDGMRRPILGQSLGTRQVGEDNPLRNAPILDNQWLGIFLDVGLLGLAAWIWLVVRVVRRLREVARSRGSPENILAAGMVASITGFAAAMLTYDSFAFIQEAAVFWVVLGLGATLIAVHRETEAALPEELAV